MCFLTIAYRVSRNIIPLPSTGQTRRVTFRSDVIKYCKHSHMVGLFSYILLISLKTLLKWLLKIVKHHSTNQLHCFKLHKKKLRCYNENIEHYNTEIVSFNKRENREKAAENFHVISFLKMICEFF